jgi:3-oxoacyl-[acyl-carrier-protein] synthase III
MMSEVIARPEEGAAVSIVAIGTALPEGRVSNADLAASHSDWDIPRVAEKTGVVERRWADAKTTAMDLGERASRNLEARRPGSLAAVDTIIFCTQSPDYVMPPNACLLQDGLGLSRQVAAFDITLACSGYVYGLWLAAALLQSGSSRTILLVTAETYSRWMHPDDRGPMTLFGDGAAATLLVAGGEGRVGPFELGTDGRGWESFCVVAGGARVPRSDLTARAQKDDGGNVRSLEHLRMNGPEVLDFVKREVPRAIRVLLGRAGLTMGQVDLVVSHQASRLSLDYLQRALGVPTEKMYSNIAKVGNTVSASIPLALADAVQEGRLLPGMIVLLVGFGVGLSWGGALVRW